MKKPTPANQGSDRESDLPPMGVAEAALTELVKEIDEGRIAVYQNVIGRTYIIFRVANRPQGSFYLYEKAVRGWLAAFAWDKEIGLLREREIDRILIVLLGLAMKTRLPHLEDKSILKILRSVPVVAVIFEFMAGQPIEGVETKMEPLWNQLKTFAKERELSRLGRKRFPGGPQVLSREIDHYKRPVFDALGIDVEMWRSNGSNIKLKRRSDGFMFQSSAEPSNSKSMAEKQLPPQDAKSDQLSRLRVMKNKQDQKGERREK